VIRPHLTAAPHSGSGIPRRAAAALAAAALIATHVAANLRASFPDAADLTPTGATAGARAARALEGRVEGQRDSSWKGHSEVRAAQPEDDPIWLPAAWRSARADDLVAPTLPATAMPTETSSAEPSPSPSPTSTPAATSDPTPTTCGAMPAFDDGLAPAFLVHVSTDGDDETGDGSIGAPFGSIGRAARELAPGGALRIGPGRYQGGAYLDGLRGEPGQPIWIGGLPDGPAPIFEGGTEALHLTRAAYVVVHDISVTGARGNGINADDGGDVADAEASHHLIFRDIEISDIGGTGNQDCLKLSGVRDVLVERLRAARCGGGGSGSGVDMVGVHRAAVSASVFEAMSGNAVQVKGGSADIDLRWNLVSDGGARAFNLGGSTGQPYFRPPLSTDAPNAEARRVRALANVIVGAETPFAFVGCADCTVAQNTIINPERWLMRILQETRSDGEYEFLPASDGIVENNIFVFERGRLRADVNVGAGTAPETFTFGHNLWFASDSPAGSAPELPGPEPVPGPGSVVGRDPELDEEFGIGPGSPARGAGRSPAAIAGGIDGVCFADPPAIGAREAAVPGARASAKPSDTIAGDPHSQLGGATTAGWPASARVRQ